MEGVRGRGQWYSLEAPNGSTLHSERGAATRLRVRTSYLPGSSPRSHASLEGNMTSSLRGQGDLEARSSSITLPDPSDTDAVKRLAEEVRDAL